MKTKILFLGLTAMMAISAAGQTVTGTGTASANNSTQVEDKGTGLIAGSETAISATLQKSLNAEKAKVGDQVVLKTTKAVKQNGEVIIKKGTRLIGKVTEVQRKSKANADSKIGILFDTLDQGGHSIPVNVSIIAVANSAAQMAAGDDLFASSSAGSTTSARGSTTAPSGGLLGGVTNTVGGLVNTAGSAVGSTVNTVGETAGTAVSTVGRSTGGLQVMNSTDASTSGSSTLSLSGGNIKLDQGTSFRLAITSTSDLSLTKAVEKN